jgi:hypothetical protein
MSSKHQTEWKIFFVGRHALWFRFGNIMDFQSNTTGLDIFYPSALFKFPTSKRTYITSSGPRFDVFIYQRNRLNVHDISWQIYDSFGCLNRKKSYFIWIFGVNTFFVAGEML